MYSRQNIFSIFYDDLIMLKFLSVQIQAIDEELGHKEKRQLAVNLITPVDRTKTFVSMLSPTQSANQDHKKSIFKWTYRRLNDGKDMSSRRDMILEIALKQPEFQLDHIIDSIDDLMEVVEKETPIT